MKAQLTLLLSVTLSYAADAGLILHHGKVVPVDSPFSVRQAVVIRAGKTVAFGSNESVLRAERGPVRLMRGKPIDGGNQTR